MMSAAGNGYGFIPACDRCMYGGSVTGSIARSQEGRRWAAVTEGGGWRSHNT